MVNIPFFFLFIDDETENLKDNDEFVEVDEIRDIEAGKDKPSVRTNRQVNQRRFSRMALGNEKSLSKAKGFTIKWGVNLS